MTALEKYRRLEGLGLWSGAREDHRREVVVGFGKASLIMRDPRTEQALSHWSLPAVSRLNAGELPALYSPDTEADEILELTDPLLIDALESICTALEAPDQRRRRSTRMIQVAILLVTVLLIGVLLPPVLGGHAASVVPMAKRIQIGEMVLADITRRDARVCNAALGSAALARMQERLFAQPRRIMVLEHGAGVGDGGAHLPGRMILLDSRLVEAQDTPQIAAGHALVEAQRAAENDPLRAVLRHAGVFATLRLLITGELSADAIAGYGAQMLARAPAQVEDTAALIERFRIAEVPTRPYAETLPESFFSELLRGRDPMSTARQPPELLSDGEWVSLQNICSDR